MSSEDSSFNHINIILLFTFILVILSLSINSCDLLENEDTPKHNDFAYLIKPDVILKPGEQRKILWLEMPKPGYLVHSSNSNLAFAVYEKDNAIPLQDSITFIKNFEGNLEVDAVEFQKSSKLFFVEITRKGNTNNEIEIEMQLKFINPEEVYNVSQIYQNKIFSPVLEFPSGIEVIDLGDGKSAFTDFVFNNYYYDHTKGISYLIYLMQQELPLVEFNKAVNYIPGATAPKGANHHENYCAISAFVRCMQTTFPDALSPYVTVNAFEWDLIGDAIDHSNIFGTRAAKLISNINKNFDASTAYVLNGKRYRAHMLENNISMSDLLMLLEVGFNIKLLIYDYPNFGHWVDVDITSTSTALRIVDYDTISWVFYNSEKGELDFEYLDPNSVTATHFKGDNNIAGDSIFEYFYFIGISQLD